MEAEWVQSYTTIYLKVFFSEACIANSYQQYSDEDLKKELVLYRNYVLKNADALTVEITSAKSNLRVYSPNRVIASPC